jgi:integrase
VETLQLGDRAQRLRLQSSPITQTKDIIDAKKPRQRVVSSREILEVWQASTALPSPFGEFGRMLLMTGQRLREVANKKWSEVNLNSKLRMIPPARDDGQRRA